MRMRHAAWALALLLVPAIALAGRSDNISFTSNVEDAKLILSCDDIEMKFWEHRARKDDFPNARRSQTLSLPSTGSTTLRVRSPRYGGIRVQPSTDGGSSALICMVAGARSESAAQSLLGKLDVRSEAGELSVTGPEDETWAAYIVLSVPDGAALDLSAVNGELVVREVSGTFTLRTINGPIALFGVSGVVDGEAVNGPIKFHGHAGDIRLAAQNGPLKVNLDASSWTGKGLRASTTNGPVKLVVPDDLRSGIEVEYSAHSPFSWNGAAQHSSEEWGRGHSVRIGDGPVLIRLSTVNGPMDIRSPKSKSSKPSKSSKSTSI